MRLNFLLFLFLLLFNSVSAQSSYFEVEETQEFRDISVIRSSYAMFSLNNDVVVLRNLRKKVLVNIFDESYQKKSSTDVLLAKDEYIIGSVLMDSKVLILTKEIKSKTLIEFHCSVFDPVTLKQSKTRLFSHSIPKKGMFSNSETVNYSKSFRTSPDGASIAFSMNSFKGDVPSAYFKVFNSSLEEVSTVTYVDPSDGLYASDDFAITNSGTIITAGKLFNNRTDKKQKKKGQYQYVFYKVTKDKDLESKTIPFDGHHISELKMSHYQNDIRVSGFYSKEIGEVIGGFSSTIENENILGVSFTKALFPLSVYTDVFPLKKARKRKSEEKGFRNYEVDYVLFDNEGNSYLLAEESYMVTNYYMQGNMVAFGSSGPIIENVIILKFSRSNELIWGRSLFKSDTETSYNALFFDAKLHVLLNTGPKVKERSNGRERLKKHTIGKSVLYDVIFDENGRESFELVRENGGRENFFNPQVGKCFNGNFVIPNFRKRDKQFLLLKVK